MPQGQNDAPTETALEVRDSKGLRARALQPTARLMTRQPCSVRLNLCEFCRRKLRSVLRFSTAEREASGVWTGYLSVRVCVCVHVCLCDVRSECQYTT